MTIDVIRPLNSNDANNFTGLTPYIAGFHLRVCLSLSLDVKFTEGRDQTFISQLLCTMHMVYTKKSECVDN